MAQSLSGSVAQWSILNSHLLLPAALVLAALARLGCVINRLSDFRGTAQRAKASSMAPAKEDLDDLGRTTWGLFYAQTITFVIGIALLAVAILATYGIKLSQVSE